MVLGVYTQVVVNLPQPRLRLECLFLYGELPFLSLWTVKVKHLFIGSYIHVLWHARIRSYDKSMVIVGERTCMVMLHPWAK